MRKLAFVVSLSLAAALLAPSAFGQGKSEIYNPLPKHMPTKARYVVEFAKAGSGGSLVYHGGPVLRSAKVIPIYWGPDWNNSAKGDFAVANSLNAYISNSTTGGFGDTHEFNVITQYYDGTGNIALSNLGAAGGALYDTSTPPQNVTDAALQSEVLKMTGNNPRTDTIYEVFLPSSSYSSSGTSDSCGGPNLQYCAYHGNFTMSNGADVKYASMPYPSCGGCQTSGFTTTQNFEHFISHETREAVTDEDGNAWWDRRGYEADDKCAWSPTPFADSSTGTNQDGTGYAYQYEWSNSAGGCVQKQ